MIPNKDQYADKDRKLTDDPEQFAFQIAVAGVFLDDRVAKRYGIEDTLVSVDEPAAPRRVMQQKNEASVEIQKAEENEETESKPKAETSEAEAAESKASVKVIKAEEKKPAAKKGEKK